jgi:uncharacterized membrane protein
MNLKVALLVPFVILANSFGNLALAWGVKHAPASAGPFLSLFEPAALAGIALLITWTAARMILLGEADLSFVLPVTSVGYALSAALGAFFLDEHISARRAAGVLLILVGAWIVSAAEQRRAAEARRP